MSSQQKSKIARLKRDIVMSDPRAREIYLSMTRDPPPSTPSYLIRKGDGTFADVSQPQREIKEWEYIDGYSIPPKNDEIRSIEPVCGEKIMQGWEKMLLEHEQKKF